MRKIASNKKINIPISYFSSGEIYALLDTIDSDDEEDRENFENKDVHKDMQSKKSANGEHFNHIPTKLPIEAGVRQVIPDEESDDDKPLSKLVKQKEPVWK